MVFDKDRHVGASNPKYQGAFVNEAIILSESRRQKAEGRNWSPITSLPMSACF